MRREFAEFPRRNPRVVHPQLPERPPEYCRAGRSGGDDQNGPGPFTAECPDDRRQLVGTLVGVLDDDEQAVVLRQLLNSMLMYALGGEQHLHDAFRAAGELCRERLQHTALAAARRAHEDTDPALGVVISQGEGEQLFDEIGSSDQVPMMAEVCGSLRIVERFLRCEPRIRRAGIPVKVLINRQFTVLYCVCRAAVRR